MYKSMELEERKNKRDTNSKGRGKIVSIYSLYNWITRSPITITWKNY